MFVLNLFKSNTLVTASVCSVFLVLLGFTDRVYATESCESPVAQIVSVQGVIEIRSANETAWRAAAMNTMLCTGDMIRARSHSRASLRLSNESMLRLDQRTTINFPQLEQDNDTSLLDLLRGAIHIITRTPKPFKVRTPFVNALVEGTEFFVGVEEESTTLILYEGQITARNDHGSLVLVDHEAAIADKNQAPQKEIIMRPIDAVQWALYYPAIIDYHRNGGRQSGPQSDDSISRLLREAADLLTVGRVDEASVVIEQAQTQAALEKNSSEIIALQAIIAVVKNDKELALNLATQAVELDPVSTAAKLALSYTLQAYFKIEDALEIVQEAVTLDSDNALLWARLAELQMSIGDLDRALNAAQQSVDLNPDIAKTQTVLGFAYLLRIDTQVAKTMFTKAIVLDQADPMPRLGMGLALIREGALEAGRIELEIATSLDPANSLIRSYLGKAYFEEKRYPLASTQFELAKERDLYDPTPWFYDAIQKQTQNRPVEALKDIQKSIELNDNRAVYRSKLLLDQDQAGRGSSLARIFQNLGFEKRALMETAKSLSFDPSNHSAHRFLSDTYANIPRHEAARVSELLQAQLMQPINVNPVQPQLAVADLNIITNTGPSSAGFNEFAPLMERNRSQLVGSGFVGNNSTFGNEIVFSKLYERTSVSLGQFHYQTNGFRTNNDQNHDILNAFVQHAVTPKLNVQAEIRTRTTDQGNLLLDFDRDSKDPLLPKNRFRRKINEDAVRIGTRYSLSPEQDIIFSGIYLDKETENIVAFSRFDSNKEIFDYVTGYQAEAQYQFRSRHFNILAGTGAYRINVKQSSRDRELFTNITANCVNNCVAGNFNRNITNGYIYSNINLSPSLNLTIGFNYGSYKDNVLNLNSFDPKFGLQWDVTKNTRLRLAWFENTKSFLGTRQTLEPTQIAGFNQLFDDITGTKSRRMGVGIDTQFGNKIFGGGEITRRELKVPVLFKDSQKQTENFYRVYLYGVMQNNWSINSEIIFEQFLQPVAINGPNQIDTLSTPVSIKYFNPNGLSANLTSTFVHQKVDRKFSTINEGTESFFLLDAAVSYRFPNRKGFLSLEGKNLLDQNFLFRNINFRTTELIDARFVPTRTVFGRITLNF